MSSKLPDAFKDPHAPLPAEPQTSPDPAPASVPQSKAEKKAAKRARKEQKVQRDRHRALDSWEPVSYTHLTLPTNREV